MDPGFALPSSNADGAHRATKGKFMAETADNVVAGPGSGPASYRTAPNNIEAEQALLGAIGIDDADQERDDARGKADCERNAQTIENGRIKIATSTIRATNSAPTPHNNSTEFNRVGR